MSQGKTFKFFGSEFRASTGFLATRPITAATNASPCVITVVGHGIVRHGAVRLAAIGGMLELNNRLFVAEVVTPDTLRLVGVDSTNFGVYTTGGTMAAATMTAHCEQTNYSFDSGATPVTEDETNCGISTQVGAPRLGSLALSFKSAENVFQDALEASRRAGTEVAFRVQVNGQTKVRYDIGFITQLTESGASGGTWDGTAAVNLTLQRVKVDV